jgi:AbrB family looped-hinge helix DNA binding protein
VAEDLDRIAPPSWWLTRPSTSDDFLPKGEGNMAPQSTIGNKGQITLPSEIRRRLRLKAGDRVEFVLQGEWTIIRPAHLAQNPFEKYAGALPAFRSEDEVNAWAGTLRDGDKPGE